MYVDPSQAQQLVVYSHLAASGAAEEREAADAEARIFLEVLWAGATPTARATFVQAMQGIASAMPWAALTPQEEGAPMRAPAAMELILGVADPGDEGTPAYRVDALTAEGVKMVAALRGWNLPVIAAITAPAGWHLDRIDKPIGVLGVVTSSTKGQQQGQQAVDNQTQQDEGPGDGQSQGQEEPQGESSDQGASAIAPAAPRPWSIPRWGWVVGGLALVGGIGVSYAMRDKE
ncbi:MAG: hypothetical protein R3B09_01735 [Nannocystaceae bacterium]